MIVASQAALNIFFHMIHIIRTISNLHLVCRLKECLRWNRFERNIFWMQLLVNHKGISIKNPWYWYTLLTGVQHSFCIWVDLQPPSRMKIVNLGQIYFAPFKNPYFISKSRTCSYTITRKISLLKIFFEKSSWTSGFYSVKQPIKSLMNRTEKLTKCQVLENLVNTSISNTVLTSVTSFLWLV